jgi:hypothetical protein
MVLVLIWIPVWEWLLSRGSAAHALPNPFETRGAALLVWLAFSLIPYTAAWAKIGCAIERRRGDVRQSGIKPAFAALGAAIGRAIVVLPATVLAGWLGLWLFRVTSYVAITNGWLDWIEKNNSPLLGILVMAFISCAIIALPIVVGWALCGKFFIGRNARDRAGFKKSGGRSFIGTVENMGLVLRAIFYATAGVGLGLLDYWYGSTVPNTGGDLFGPMVNDTLRYMWLAGQVMLAIGIACLAFFALRDLLGAFRRTGDLGPSGVHGRADLASEEQAAAAARGRSEPGGVGNLNLDY